MAPLHHTGRVKPAMSDYSSRLSRPVTTWMLIWSLLLIGAAVFFIYFCLAADRRVVLSRTRLQVDVAP